MITLKVRTIFKQKRQRRKQREKATPGKGLPVIFNPLSLESRILLRVIEKYSLWYKIFQPRRNNRTVNEFLKFDHCCFNLFPVSVYPTLWRQKELVSLKEGINPEECKTASNCNLSWERKKSFQTHTSQGVFLTFPGHFDRHNNHRHRADEKSYTSFVWSQTLLIMSAAHTFWTIKTWTNCSLRVLELWSITRHQI